MFKFFLFVIILTTIACKIRFVFEIFRHGARSPILDGQNKTDYLGKSWIGDGELTSVGMRQHFLLGHRNRLVYKDFLSPSYNVSEIYIMSTNYNRTIMSAYSQLQGLFPPSTGPELYNNQTDLAIPPCKNTNFSDIQKELGLNVLPFKSQVLPIHIIDKNAHQFSLHDYPYCKGVKGIIDANIKKEEIKNFIQNYTNKYSDFLNKTYGIQKLDLEVIYRISDSFVAGYFEKFEFTEMIDAKINLDEFMEYSINSLDIDMFSGRFDDEGFYLGKMSMSPTYRSIIDWMNTRISYDSKGVGYTGYKAPKLVMLSGHDTNLAAMQAFLRAAFNNEVNKFYYTPFASAMFFELHVDDNAVDPKESDYKVKCIYNDIELFTLNYTEFRDRVIKNLIPQSEINNFCGFDEEEVINSTSLILLTIVLSCFTLSLLIIVVIMCIRKKREENYSSPAYKSVV